MEDRGKEKERINETRAGNDVMLSVLYIYVIML